MTPVSRLDMPPLIAGPISHPLGSVVHHLRPAETAAVVSVTEVSISARRKAPLYLLSNGESILIVTEGAVKQRPVEATGALRVDEQGKLKWLYHSLLDSFNEDVQSRGWDGVAKAINESWAGQFNYRQEIQDQAGNVTQEGLRPPQIGGLHAIGAHWSLYSQPGTLVIPTGTGKTETMLATLVTLVRGPLLVVVPSRILRYQTAKKFTTFGLLRKLGNLAADARNPIVGIMHKRPNSEQDLDLFTKCNVVVTTMSAVNAEEWVGKIAERITTLVVDEAHHIAANGWAAFKEQFSQCKTLQFTATPFRRDGKLVDGKVLFNYPLQFAQRDGYFKKIVFAPVYEIDDANADRVIAEAAIQRLREDLAAGLDHRLMARCADITRSEAVYQIYADIASDLRPALVHSEDGDSEARLDALKSGASKIVVCVNMLGEGFDLPQLKIAAVHDSHKSLAVLLQFTGRFTRSAGANIGDATVIANIADADISGALERLYSEDADWNQLLSELSSQAAKSHAELVDFLRGSDRLDDIEEHDSVEISHHLLRPTLSTLVYDAPAFQPKAFFRGLSSQVKVHRVWLHNKSNTLYFVSRVEPSIQWTRSRSLKDRQWHLFILHWDAERKLLYLSSSDRSSMHDGLAKSVGATDQISGDRIFRVLGKISRLIFQNVGVRKYGRRNLSFALYTGADVAEALSITEKAGSVKSNLSGMGWAGGQRVTIGCSLKGRIWTREAGTVPEFVSWCHSVGEKLQDVSIDTSEIIANVLIPEEVKSLPEKPILALEWPYELDRQPEERVVLSKDGTDLPILMVDIQLANVDAVSDAISFKVVAADNALWGEFRLTVGGEGGYKVAQISGSPIGLTIGSLQNSLEAYLCSYPPLVRFIDLSELDGNLLIRPQKFEKLTFPAERFEAWDWTDVDVTKESIWKDGSERQDSIQWRAATNFISGGFEVVFDDDAPGESADLVCMKEEADHIRLALVHCKFTRAIAGERIKDVVEVCSQAVRSAKWKWKFKDLCRHILTREKNLKKADRPTRFLRGNSPSLNKFIRISRFKEIRPEIIVVQPGLAVDQITDDQNAVLASSYSYLKETIGVDLDVICSSGKAAAA